MALTLCTQSLVVWAVWPYFEQVSVAPTIYVTCPLIVLTRCDIDARFTVILLSRFILNLRALNLAGRSARLGEGSDARDTSTTSLSFSEILFNKSNIVGSLGAPLEHQVFDRPFVAVRKDSAGSFGEDKDLHGLNEGETGIELDEFDNTAQYSSDPFREGMLS